jgi:hypothetical protein
MLHYRSISLALLAAALVVLGCSSKRSDSNRAAGAMVEGQAPVATEPAGVAPATATPAPPSPTPIPYPNVTAPRDKSTGMASGKRQHEPIH